MAALRPLVGETDGNVHTLRAHHECCQTTTLSGMIGGNIVRVCLEIARPNHEQ
jgi:hypothetical protein